jgi:hypothetical protein
MWSKEQQKAGENFFEGEDLTKLKKPKFSWLIRFFNWVLGY